METKLELNYFASKKALHQREDSDTFHKIMRNRAKQSKSRNKSKKVRPSFLDKTAP